MEGKRLKKWLILFSRLGLSAVVFGAYSSVGSLPRAPASPSFPVGFFWGVASSAFQVEGRPADSDWSRFTHRNGAIRDGTNADRATDFWDRYEEDLALAEKIGLNAFRISIAWERIEPRRGEWDPRALDHYRQIIRAIRQHGMEPIVTLEHFTLPGWLADEGGLLSPNFVRAFTEYAVYVVKPLSAGTDGVHYWLTLNEPELMAFLGYDVGAWPPALPNSAYGAEALYALADAHVSAVQMLRPLVPIGTKFGIAKNWMVFTPYRELPLDRIATSLANRYGNHSFLEALTTGRVNFRLLHGGALHRRLPVVEGEPTLDFIGVNYYTRNEVGMQFKKPYYFSNYGPGPKSDLGWEIFPEGIEVAIRDVYRTFKLPVLVTENGIADAGDTRRSEFLADHLEKIRGLIGDGIPVLGYLHWSLTDNFEWAEGLTPRFGLVKIDYSTLARKPRPSFQAYGAWIARERGRNPN
jgi:beta-glucosidase